MSYIGDYQAETVGLSPLIQISARLSMLIDAQRAAPLVPSEQEHKTRGVPKAPVLT